MKYLFIIIFIFLSFNPAISKDMDRIQSLKEEIEKNHLKSYLEDFELYSFRRGYDNADSSIYAANRVIKSLNSLINKYPTVNQLYFLTTEIIESGYYENTPLLLSNLNFSLETIRNYGYGTAKIEPWQLKRLDMFCNLKAPDGVGFCKQDKDNLFYSTITHSAKKYSFGFFESVSKGFLNEKELSTAKCLGMYCS